MLLPYPHRAGCSFGFLAEILLLLLKILEEVAGTVDFKMAAPIFVFSSNDTHFKNHDLNCLDLIVIGEGVLHIDGEFRCVVDLGE